LTLLLTHLKSEFFHAVWDRLLDNNFGEAYNKGMVLECVNGTTRRIFPQIFTYLADILEKSVSRQRNETRRLMCYGVQGTCGNNHDKGLTPCTGDTVPGTSFDCLGSA
jgi:hypothetical protein